MTVMADETKEDSATTTAVVKCLRSPPREWTGQMTRFEEREYLVLVDSHSRYTPGGR